MNKTLTKLLLPVVLTGAVLADAAARADDVVTAVSTKFQSKYVFRGLEFGGESMMSDAFIGYKNLCLIALQNYDLKDGEVTESDLFGEFALGDVVLGAAKLTFPNIDCKSREFYARTNVQGIDLLVAHDDQAGDGTYIEVGKQFGDLGVKVGYNDHQWREGSGLSHAEATLSKTFDVDGLQMTPSVTRTVPLSRDFEYHTIFGLKVGKEF